MGGIWYGWILTWVDFVMGGFCRRWVLTGGFWYGWVLSGGLSHGIEASDPFETVLSYKYRVKSLQDCCNPDVIFTLWHTWNSYMLLSPNDGEETKELRYLSPRKRKWCFLFVKPILEK